MSGIIDFGVNILSALAAIAATAPFATSGSSNLSEPCPVVAVRLDTAASNVQSTMALGHALGQTFLASDTLIRLITVWRWQLQDTSFVGVKLYITETDTLGRPLYDRVLFNGPPVFNYYGDGVHPIRYDFVFDPPFALPYRGTFCFAIQSYPCTGTTTVLASSNNPYDGGMEWVFGRSDCTLRPTPPGFPDYDLIFEIEFCEDPTPTLQPTWGQLKQKYR